MKTESFHPSEYIKEEMAARNWNQFDLVMAMIEREFQIKMLAVEMYLAIGAKNPGMRMGDMSAEFARAFGTSVELFTNLEAAWVKAQEELP